jgi:hypothetical protein
MIINEVVEHVQTADYHISPLRREIPSVKYAYVEYKGIIICRNPNFRSEANSARAATVSRLYVEYTARTFKRRPFYRYVQNSRVCMWDSRVSRTYIVVDKL